MTGSSQGISEKHETDGASERGGSAFTNTGNGREAVMGSDRGGLGKHS